MCCVEGAGVYEVSMNEVVLAVGGAFASVDSFRHSCLPTAATATDMLAVVALVWRGVNGSWSW
jgi:hypothetical protein